MDVRLFMPARWVGGLDITSEVARRLSGLVLTADMTGRDRMAWRLGVRSYLSILSYCNVQTMV